MKIDVGFLLGEAEHLLTTWWRFRKARSFADLLDRNITELIAGREDEADDPGGDPGYWQMLTTEIQLNRCGMLTEYAAAGGRNENSGLEYRAAVTGFVTDPDVLTWLEVLLGGSRYRMQLHHLYVPPAGDTETIAERTRRTGISTVRGIDSHNGYMSMGRAETGRDLFMLYPVHPAAGRELRAATRVTIYDSQWGDSDLFSVLLTAALDRTPSTSEA